MTWDQAAPQIFYALSMLTVWFITRAQHLDTVAHVQTESSKIQLGVAEHTQSARDDLSAVIDKSKSAQIISSMSLTDRMTALERKQDLVIENLRRKPGSPWIDEITTVTEPKG